MFGCPSDKEENWYHGEYSPLQILTQTMNIMQLTQLIWFILVLTKQIHIAHFLQKHQKGSHCFILFSFTLLYMEIFKLVEALVKKYYTYYPQLNEGNQDYCIQNYQPVHNEVHEQPATVSVWHWCISDCDSNFSDRFWSCSEILFS